MRRAGALLDRFADASDASETIGVEVAFSAPAVEYDLRMKRSLLELRSWLQGNGINPEGIELVLVVPDEDRRKRAHDALMTDLSFEEASGFGASGKVSGVTVAIESASRDAPESGGRRSERRRAR